MAYTFMIRFNLNCKLLTDWKVQALETPFKYSSYQQLHAYIRQLFLYIDLYDICLSVASGNHQRAFQQNRFPHAQPRGKVQYLIVSVHPVISLFQMKSWASIHFTTDSQLMQKVFLKWSIVECSYSQVHLLGKWMALNRPLHFGSWLFFFFSF